MFKYAIPIANIAKKNQMRARSLIIILLFTLAGLTMYGRPTRPGTYTITQPDGTTFMINVYGDEFFRIKTTPDGHAVVQDKDGWWCYASFDSEGNRSSSGHRVGKDSPSFPGSTIPYEKLREQAREKRRVCQLQDRPPLISRIIQKNGILTKADGKATKHGLVILAEYSDVPFQYKKEDFVNLLTQKGYSHNGATGCAKEYFDAQFGGMVDFDFDVSEIVTLSGPRAYYGANTQDGTDKRPGEMVKEACELADKEGIDFSLYDDDGDGVVDNVFVFFAGGDEAEHIEEEDYIWSHAWYIYSGAGIKLTLDGMIIDRYACTSELSIQPDGKDDIAGIGTFCHEYNHTFDLPDFYDTDYDEAGGWAAGMWISTSLMDGGNMNNNSNTPPYFNAIERELLGIAEPVMLENDGTYTLEPIHSSNTFYRLDTDTEGEYYLFECRSGDGWDEYIGGTGMLVYHIDRSSKYIKRWTEDNTVNAHQSHQCADLIEADSRNDGFASDRDYASAIRNISGIFFPYNSVTSLTPVSTPGLKFWSGRAGEISITGIRRNGSNISFSVVGFSDTSTPPTPRNIRSEVFMDAAIINFESSWAHSGNAVVKWGRTGQDSEETIVKPYESGKYSITLENLVPGNKTYSVEIWFEVNGIKGESLHTSFMTTKTAPVDWPYMFLGKSAANSDGTFDSGAKIALRVYNAAEAENIRWTFNGKTIVPGGDGYFTLTQSGTLKAFVSWEDGSQDIIEKQIIISNEE